MSWRGTAGVAEAYRLWWEIKSRIEIVYTDTPADPPPLSRCEDFKSIRNTVIQEAMNIRDGILTFEEPASVDTALPEPESWDDGSPYTSLAEDEASESAYDFREHTRGRESSGGCGSSDTWWTG